MTLAPITLGAGTAQPQGRLAAFDGTASGLLELLAGLPPVIEGWWSPHTWTNAYRDGERWQGASALVLDLDYYGAPIHDEKRGRLKSNHAMVPDALRSQLETALLAGDLGNLFHNTPRGARLVFVLAEPVADSTLFERGIAGGCAETRRFLEQLGVHATANGGILRDGFAVDEAATDLARFLYAPRARVNGTQRAAEVHLLRAEPYKVEQLAVLAPESEQPSSNGARGWTEFRGDGDLADAVARWNADHRQDFGRPGAGECPACGHRDCFGAHPVNADRWCCHSDNHGRDSGCCGFRSPKSKWMGDALDLETYRRQCSRAAVLRADGYLGERKSTPTMSENDGRPRIVVRNDLLEVTREAEARLVAPLQWRRFPIEALPPACRRLVFEAAEARGVDAAYVGVPMLPVLAGAIGNARILRLKAAYSEPAVLWAAVAQRSGSLKSAGLDDVLRPHRERNRRLLEETRAAFTDYELELARHRKAKNDHLPRPPHPPHRAVVADDITAEALTARLADNPRGLLLGVDELAGWVSSFDAYKQRRGADVNKFLTMHRAGPLRSDRKGGDEPTIYVPRAALSIVGTIQPRTLARVMGTDNVENGLLGRLLLAMPPTPRAHWSDEDVAFETFSAWRDVVFSLLDLDCGEDPSELTLASDAWPTWREFHDVMIDRAVAEDDQLASAIAKLRGGALRIALVLALARAAEEGRSDSLRIVDRLALDGGIALASWFAHEVERVYGALRASPEQRAQALLLEYIAWSGGRTTPRHLARYGPASCRGPGAAEPALMALVKAGRGRWVDIPPGPTGGRPTREFVLTDEANATEPLQDGENSGFRSVACNRESANEEVAP